MRLSTVVTGVTSGVAAVVMLASPAVACGTPRASAAAGAGPVVTAPAAAADRLGPRFLGWCTGRNLRGVVEPPDAGAGQRYSRLLVTNVSRRTCVLFGYSRLRLQEADGNPLPTRVQPTTSPRPQVVVLRPGQRAAENLHWTVVPGPGEPVDEQCQPDPAWLWVWPSPRAWPLPVSWTFGPVCLHGRIDLSAFYHI